MTFAELWPHSIWLGSTVLCLVPFFCTPFCFSFPALFLLRPAVETVLLHPHKQALFTSSPLSVWAGDLSLPSAPSWYIYAGIQPMHLCFYSLPLRHSGHKKQSLTLPKTSFVFCHHSGLPSILVSLTYLSYVKWCSEILFCQDKRGRWREETLRVMVMLIVNDIFEQFGHRPLDSSLNMFLEQHPLSSNKHRLIRSLKPRSKSLFGENLIQGPSLNSKTRIWLGW